ncbi:hypothetical protein Plec18170_002331 [Paecilomyces lecythidis]
MPKDLVQKKRRVDAAPCVKVETSEDGGEQSDFWEPFRRLFNSPVHYDVKLCIGKQRIPFHGHSLVFQIRCPRLARLLPTQSSTKRNIAFEVHKDACTIRRMLEYIYTGNYSRASDMMPHPCEEDIDEHILTHTKLFLLAHEYELAGLKDICYTRCKEACKDEWDCASFCESIRELFATDQVAPNMLNLMTDTALSHADELLLDERFSRMLKDNPDVSVFFARNLLSRHRSSEGSDSTL